MLTKTASERLFFDIVYFYCDAHYFQHWYIYLHNLQQLHILLLKSIHYNSITYALLTIQLQVLLTIQLQVLLTMQLQVLLTIIQLHYSTEQYDYLLNLRYPFIHFLQNNTNNTITDTAYIHSYSYITTMSNKIKDVCILKQKEKTTIKQERHK